MSFDVRPLIEFVDTEFRARFRNVVDQITEPVPRRVDRFTCWPGLTVEQSDTSSGKLVLGFKRNPSKLRVGEHIYVNPLATEPKDVISGPEGVIQSLDETECRVVIVPGYQQAARFGSRFRLGDRIVLDQTLPGARLSREMPVLALRLVSGELGEAPRLKRIRSLMEGKAEPRPTDQRKYVPAADPALAPLTEAQHEAIRRAVETDFALIQGPPGTGKTFVLGLLIRELTKRGLKVGVCAFTHQAINNLLLECLKYESINEVCKLGSKQSWSGPPEHPRLRLVAKPSQYFRAKGTSPVTGFTQHAAFHPVGSALGKGFEGALPDRFDVIVFDEAGQLTLPAAVMAMVHAERFVIAGDHCQLPPVVQTLPAGFGAGVSVFQHLVERAGYEPVLLDRTFRLNDALLDFPGKEFYDGRVESAPEVKDRKLEIATDDSELSAILSPDRPSQLAIVRHEGRGQESPEEAALVAALVDEALRGGVPPEEIAVIAPHRRQNVKIRELLAKLGHAGAHPLVDTVERIQGQERDLVILSMTLSDPDVLAAELDFLFLPNRFNVAITRARRKLIVTASPAFFRTLPRHQALAAPGRNPLASVNVLKRWYFQHRSSAIDATLTARRALARMNDESVTTGSSRETIV